jgi:cytochrome c biogenesis protein CcdA
MLILTFTIFVLGVLAFLDTVFNYGSLFRYVFSGSLIVLSGFVYLKAKSIGDFKKMPKPVQKPAEPDPVQNSEEPSRAQKPESVLR